MFFISNISTLKSLIKGFANGLGLNPYIFFDKTHLDKTINKNKNRKKKKLKIHMPYIMIYHNLQFLIYIHFY